MWEPVRLPAGLKGPESYKRPLSLTLVRFISDARTARGTRAGEAQQLRGWL